MLTAAAHDAAAGAGSVALVFGEAGIGKSSLIDALRAHLPTKSRVLVGYCDDLADSPRSARSAISSVVWARSRNCRAEWQRPRRDVGGVTYRADRPGHPTLLAIADVHWADDPTLDALRYLVRRIHALPAVLVLTYRDDELTREHPLQQLLGQASSADHVRRTPLQRLSAPLARHDRS